MVSTYGTKQKPLPEALTTALHGLGYLKVEGADVFRHPKRRELFVAASASNIPGDTDMVLARWFGERTRRISVDELIDLLQRQLEQASIRLERRSADARDL